MMTEPAPDPPPQPRQPPQDGSPPQQAAEIWEIQYAALRSTDHGRRRRLPKRTAAVVAAILAQPHAERLSELLMEEARQQQTAIEIERMPSADPPAPPAWAHGETDPAGDYA